MFHSHVLRSFSQSWVFPRSRESLTILRFTLHLNFQVVDEQTLRRKASNAVNMNRTHNTSSSSTMDNVNLSDEQLNQMGLTAVPRGKTFRE